MLIKMMMKSIVFGHLGIHGLIVLSHAEVEPVQKIEQNQLLKHMVVRAKETRQKLRSAMNRNAQVRLLLILQKIIFNYGLGVIYFLNSEIG